MKQLYKNNVAYLFKKDKSNTATYAVDGIPLSCNRETKKTTIFNPQSNTYKSDTTEVIKTTTQLDYAEFDKIAFTSSPTVDDFSTIATDGISRIPYMEKGNKYRNVDYWDYTITIT